MKEYKFIFLKCKDYVLNPVPWQNRIAAYLGYTLRMKTLFRCWPVMVDDMHTRRRRSSLLWKSTNWYSWNVRTVFWLYRTQLVRSSTPRRICCCVKVLKLTWPMSAACRRYMRVSFTRSSRGLAVTAWASCVASLLPALFLSQAQQLASKYKKLSYRWQTARCWFVKLLRYGRTFCQNT